MSEKSGSDLNIEIAQRLQERFETYWVSLIFTLLALSVQSAKFGAAVPADILELLSWLLLLVAGLAGLSRFESIPELYRLFGLQLGQEEKAQAVQKAMLQGARSVYVAPLKGEQSAAEYVAGAEAGARQLEAAAQPLEASLRKKYRLKKWSFVLAICCLISSRAYLPVLHIMQQLSPPPAKALPTPSK